MTGFFLTSAVAETSPGIPSSCSQLDMEPTSCCDLTLWPLLWWRFSRHICFSIWWQPEVYTLGWLFFLRHAARRLRVWSVCCCYFALVLWPRVLSRQAWGLMTAHANREMPYSWVVPGPSAVFSLWFLPSNFFLTPTCSGGGIRLPQLWERQREESYDLLNCHIVLKTVRRSWSKHYLESLSFLCIWSVFWSWLLKSEVFLKPSTWSFLLFLFFMSKRKGNLHLLWSQPSCTTNSHDICFQASFRLCLAWEASPEFII